MKLKYFWTRIVMAIIVGILALPALAQSLGDAARQAREKKQKKATGTTASVYTNDNLPQGKSKNADASIQTAAPDQPAPSKDSPAETKTPSPSNGDDAEHKGAGQKSADQWRQQILAQKKVVAGLREESDKLQASIHNVPDGMYSIAPQNTEAQRRKQQSAEQAQKRLADETKKLQDMQDGARSQGFGGNVYDPD